jgi:hypothetical protein
MEGGMQVHHKHYRHVFNELEHIECLELLCEDCHRYHHGLSKVNPVMGYGFDGLRKMITAVLETPYMQRSIEP